MRFSAILTIPLLFAGILATPGNAEVLSVRTDGVVANTEKVCFLGKCINIGKAGPKCNIDRK